MLTREQILEALTALNEKMAARETHGEPPARISPRAVFLVREILGTPSSPP